PFQFLEEIDTDKLRCINKCNLNLLDAEYRTSLSLTLNGQTCCNKVVIKQIPVKEPPLYYAKAFVHFLKQKNINFTGEITYNKHNPVNTEKIFEYCTPLKRLLQHLVKSSDNLVADVLVKYLGYHLFKQGSFEKGTLAIYNFISSLVNNKYFEVAIYDGSGISRLNKVSPYIIIKVLEYLYETLKDDIYSIFPYGGEKRTTLRGRFKNFPVKIWAKSGFLNNAYALSGIVNINTNIFLFSILYNGNLGRWTVYNIQEKILKTLLNINNNRKR
ncbi:MAG: D-alanyl-D-alanine carboxypeptidase, partial [Planctomycetota bacterium]